jgi:hypothetical protein
MGVIMPDHPVCVYDPGMALKQEHDFSHKMLKNLSKLEKLYPFFLYDATVQRFHEPPELISLIMLSSHAFFTNRDSPKDDHLDSRFDSKYQTQCQKTRKLIQA